MEKRVKRNICLDDPVTLETEIIMQSIADMDACVRIKCRDKFTVREIVQFWESDWFAVLCDLARVDYNSAFEALRLKYLPYVTSVLAE